MKLQKKINYIVAQTLLEIRSDFKWNDFKKIQDPEERISYLEKTRTRNLGEGSARSVYLLSSRFVIKVALPNNFQAGAAQNKEEVSISTDPTVKPIIAEVFDTADDFSWIVAELVRPLRSKLEFEKFTDIPFNLFKKMVTEIFDGRFETNVKKRISMLQRSLLRLEQEKEDLIDKSELYPQFYDKFERHMKYVQQDIKSVNYEIKEEEEKLALLERPFVKAVSELILDKDAMAADMRALGHWGKTADGRIVLLDYGYSKEVARKHYGQYWL